MRISSTTMVDNYLSQLNKVYEEQTKLMQQADGSKLHRPSDDAIGYSKYLRYSISRSENTQYTTNVKSGISWMKNSDSTLVDVERCLSVIVEKTVQAANETNGETDMKAIAREMEAMVQQAVSDLNTNVNGRYLFSGQDDLIKPYTISNEKYHRGLTKNLDDKQSSFFNDQNTVNGTNGLGITQMLALKDGNDNQYYLNTITGEIYSYDFMQEGYKECISKGYNNVGDAAAAGLATSCGSATTVPVSVSDYFDKQGVINTTGRNMTFAVTDPDGNTVQARFATVEQHIVTYVGDFKHISMTKENGPEQQASDSVNLNGADICGTDIFDNQFSAYDASGNPIGTPSGTAVLNALYTVVSKTDSSENLWLDEDGVSLSNNAYDTVLVGQTKLAARLNVYNEVETMLGDQALTITSDISSVADTDVAYLSVMLNTIRTVYSMSLSVGGRILPMSLADYL